VREISNLKSRITIALAFLMLPILIATAGCALTGAVAYKVTQGDKIPAKYVPEAEPMVVVAENWRNPDGSSTDAEQLARFIWADLRDHNVAQQIDPTEVMDLKSRTSNFHSMTVAQIGKRVGAQQVLYINITDIAVEGAVGADSRRAKCTARVKIIDAETGKVLWPSDLAQGYPVATQTSMVQIKSQEDEVALHQTLQEQTAVKIARLFYETSADD
jgi:hypothetical protein